MGASASWTIGKYRLLERLGAGGMGEVYLAEDTRVGRRVAIKVLSSARSDEFIERFYNEARIHQQLYHPNIASLLETVQTAAGPALVMEYLGGPELTAWAAGPPPRGWHERLEAFVGVARAVGYLHAHGIVHRDIKPENIKLASDGTPKLLDFGIARDAGTPSLTVAGNYIGTVQYSAPERLAGKPADPRSDVWSLGVLLYELLSGRAPFEGDSITGLLDRIRKGRYVALGDVGTGLPDGCNELIARSVAVDPDARFEDAGAFAVAAEDVLAEALGGARLRRRRPAGRHSADRLPLAILGLTLVVGGGLAAVVLWPDGTPPHEAPAFRLPDGSRDGAGSGEPAGLTLERSANLEPDEPQTQVPVHIGSFVSSHELYDRDGRKIGSTPFDMRVPFGARVWIECRRADRGHGRVLDFQAGMNNNYSCGE